MPRSATSDIGVPEAKVRLLTRAEAGALASEVQSAVVEDRAARVAGLQDLYGPLFGRAMTELSQAGLDPRHRALAWARHTPALARAIAQTMEPGGDGPEKDLDPAVVKDVRGRLSDATAEAASAAPPGGETAEDIRAVLSVAGDLALQNFRETGDVEESAARAAAFANDAIEDARLTAADGGEGDQSAGGAGDDSLTGGERIIDADDDDQPAGASGNTTLTGDFHGGSEEGIPVVAPGAKGRGEDGTAAGDEPDPTAGAEEQAAPGATRGERPDQSRRSVKDLRRLYRDRKIPDDIAGTLAKTGVVPQVEPKLDGKKVELIRAVRDLDPKDEKAVKALRKRIRRELGRSPGFHDAFQLEVTARIAGRKRDVSVRQLARFAVIEFGREIDPENAKLLAAVLEATPENLKDVLGRINRRFGGMSGGSVAYKPTLRGVIQFKQTGGKQGLSPKAAAEQLMPYVDGRIAEGNRKVAKIAIDVMTMGRSGLIAEVIKIINLAESLRSLSGTPEQLERAGRRINSR